MNNKNQKNKNQERQSIHIANAVSTGLVTGAALGAVWNNIALGSGIGMLIAIFIISLKYNKNNTVKKNLAKIALVTILATGLILSIPKIFSHFF